MKIIISLFLLFISIPLFANTVNEYRPTKNLPTIQRDHNVPERISLLGKIRFNKSLLWLAVPMLLTEVTRFAQCIRTNCFDLFLPFATAITIYSTFKLWQNLNLLKNQLRNLSPIQTV